MLEEMDPLTVRCLKGAAEMMAGLGALLLLIAEREEPEKGAALFSSELRCIVADTIQPARLRLEELAERTEDPEEPAER
jgi:hypothetical protein